MSLSNPSQSHNKPLAKFTLYRNANNALRDCMRTPLEVIVWRARASYYVTVQDLHIRTLGCTCEVDPVTTVMGYIDDAAILACGDITAETCSKLKVALEKAQNWATAHAFKFAPGKF
jgi:hypothetical protein